MAEFDHSTRTTKFFQNLLGFCVCEHCAKLPEVEVVKSDPFDIADYYAWNDPEVLEHDNIADVLHDFFEANYEKGVPILDAIAKHEPVKVTAYKRSKVHESFWHGLADHLVDAVSEYLIECDEWPDMDSEIPGWTGEVESKLAGDFEQVLRKLTDLGVHPYNCVEVAWREFSAEELEKILRETEPEWFEEK